MMNRFAKLGLLAGTSYVVWSYGALAQQIPSFPSATTPFSGGEQTYLVQGGASKNMTLNQLATWAGPTTPNTTTLRNSCTSATNCPSGDPIYASGVVRLTDGTAGAPPHYFGPDINSICTADDVGRCVASANSGFWLAPASSIAEATQWSVLCDNNTNTGPALQAALNAAGSGAASTIVLPNNKRCGIGSNIFIPSGITLSGGNPNIFGSVNLGALNTTPGIVLNPANTISQGGTGAGVTSCLIVASGITYPVTGTPTWSGIALNDSGFGAFKLTNLEIVGFDTAIKITGNRPYVRNVWADGSGVTNAVFEFDVGNTSSGYFLDSRVTTFAENSPVIFRPGTGVRIGRGPSIGQTMFMDGIVSIFMSTDYDFENGALIGTIDADGNPAAPGQVGIFVASGIIVDAYEMEANQLITGIINNGVIYAGSIHAGFSTTCMTNSGLIYANIVSFGQCASAAYTALSSSSIFSTSNLQAILTNSRVAPYFTSSAGSISFGDIPSDGIAGGFRFESLSTDLSGNLFSSNYFATANSEPMLSMMQVLPIITETGAGSGATYTLGLRSNVSSPVIIIKAGSGAASSGTVTATYPVSALTGLACITGLGAGGWASPALPVIGTAPRPASFTVTWGQATSLVSGASYPIITHCAFN